MAEDLTSEQREEINAHLFAGRKIQAIKILRETTGSDLKTAKDAIEAHEAALRQSSPEKFSASAGKGCMACIVALFMLAVPLVTFIKKVWE